MKKKILRVQPLYTMLIWFVALSSFVFLLFLPQILQWETGGPYGVIYYCTMSVCASISVIILIYYLQFAYVDSEGIVIRGVFYQIVKLRWKDIRKVTCEKIVTYDNRENIYLKWIVIKTHSSDEVEGRAGRNKKNKSPWCIIATKKNMEIISQYIEITDLYPEMQ